MCLKYKQDLGKNSFFQSSSNDRYWLCLFYMTPLPQYYPNEVTLLFNDEPLAQLYPSTGPNNGVMISCWIFWFLLELITMNWNPFQRWFSEVVSVGLHFNFLSWSYGWCVCMRARLMIFSHSLPHLTIHSLSFFYAFDALWLFSLWRIGKLGICENKFSYPLIQVLVLCLLPKLHHPKFKIIVSTSHFYGNLQKSFFCCIIIRTIFWYRNFAYCWIIFS